MLDAASISIVLDAYRPERAAFIELLRDLDAAALALPTECPAYDVRGVASHVLGDDLSLLSRQRDASPNGLLLMAEGMPGADFRTLLDAFNDAWVTATRFLSPELLVELLELTGEWTAAYYEAVDPEKLGEPVGFFGSRGQPSPFWHAIGREFVERWIHHSQVRRALGLGSVSDRRFLTVGVEVVAAAFGVEYRQVDGKWELNGLVLGDDDQTSAILTRGHTVEEIRSLVAGPPDRVDLLAMVAGRP